MSINISVIDRELSINSSAQFKPKDRNKKCFSDVPLKGVLLWTSDVAVRKNYAIIISSADYIKIRKQNSDYFNACALLCIGKVALSSADENCDILLLDEDTDAIALSNALQLFFSQYREWETTIFDQSNTINKLESLLNDSSRFAKIDFFVINFDYSYAAMSKSFYLHNQSWLGEGKISKLEYVNTLLFNKDFKKTFEEKDVFVFPSFLRDEFFWSYNILYNGKYIARLLPQVQDREVMAGDKHYIRILGQAITEIYKRHYNSLENDSDNVQFRNLLKKMIAGNHQVTEKSKELLVYRNWQKNHTYQIVKFKLSLENSAGTSLEYFCSQIEAAFKECCAVKLTEGIFCVRNITLGQSSREFLEELPYFLRENICKAGISNQFNNFLDLNIFCIEANQALLFGESKDSMLWYYHFKDYAFLYIRDQCAQELPFKEICHPAINILKAYDKEDNSELYLTLKTFFELKYNGSHAAEKLCIHRTTFFYRLKKIKQLTNINLDDFQERSYLMFSFLLLD
jgi:sugar diacid utilization regulator